MREEPPQIHAEYPRYPQAPMIRFETIVEAWKLMTPDLGVWVIATFFMLLLPLLFAGPIYFLMVSEMMQVRNPQLENILVIYAYMIPAMLLAFVGQAVGMAGLFSMAAKKIDGQPIAVKDFFLSAHTVPTHLGAAFLMSLVIGIGSLFCYLPGLLVAGLLLFTQPIIVHEKLGAIAALTKSWEMLKSQIWMALGFYLVVTIVCSLGAIACGIGMLVTYPIYPLAVTLVYRDHLRARPSPPVLSQSPDWR